MVFYWLGATFTFSILLHAFYRDTETPKTDLVSWAVLVVGTVIWFIVLPGILRKKFLTIKAAHAAETAKAEGWIS